MDQAAEAWAWALDNWGVVLTGIYIVLNLIVAATPGKKDDRALARVMGALSGLLSAGLFGSHRLPATLRSSAPADSAEIVAAIAKEEE